MGRTHQGAIAISYAAIGYSMAHFTLSKGPDAFPYFIIMIACAVFVFGSLLWENSQP